MTDHDFAAKLQDLLDATEWDDDVQAATDLRCDRVSTFEEEGVLTMNAGLVVKLADGTEFQLTVVRSR